MTAKEFILFQINRDLKSKMRLNYHYFRLNQIQFKHDVFFKDYIGLRKELRKQIYELLAKKHILENDNTLCN